MRKHIHMYSYLYIYRAPASQITHWNQQWHRETMLHSEVKQPMALILVRRVLYNSFQAVVRHTLSSWFCPKKKASLWVSQPTVQYFVVINDADSLSRSPAQSWRNVCPVSCIPLALSFSHPQWVKPAYSHTAASAESFTFDRKEGMVSLLLMDQTKAIPLNKDGKRLATIVHRWPLHMSWKWFLTCHESSSLSLQRHLRLD